MRARWIIVLAILGTTSAEAEPLSDGLKKATDCMLQVLKTTPGVAGPKIDTAKGSVCLEYRPDEKDVWEQPTTFCLDTNFHVPETPYVFTGFFPGFVPSDGDLDIHVSDSVMKKWNAQCGVFAQGIFA
jgi:hypothetical protein